MDLKEKIQDMLGHGVAPTAIAVACGCEPSYISQLMAKPDFNAKVLELRALRLLDYTDRDDKINTLEDMLLAKVKIAIPMMMKPSEILMAFKVINGAARRGADTPAAVEQLRPTVTLNLPSITIQNLVVNPSGQIVEVAGRSMVTMPSKQALNLLTAQGEQNAT